MSCTGSKCGFDWEEVGRCCKRGLTYHQGDANVAEEERNPRVALFLESTGEVVDGALLRAAGGGRRGGVAGPCHFAGDI